MADLLSGDSQTRAPRRPVTGSRAVAPSVAAAPPPAAPAAPVTPPVTTATPPAAPVAQPVQPPTPIPGERADSITLAKTDVDSALADFAKLTLAVHGSFTGAGALIDGVSDGTIFQRAGLRAGDLITAIDGTQLRTLDDTANLYARAASVKAMTVQLVRNGKPIALHVTIR
jgi:type II secretory pathway component PulC